MKKYSFVYNNGVAISRINNFSFITHSENNNNYNRVFPIYHESIYLFKEIQRKIKIMDKNTSELSILDLCTGCGIHAILISQMNIESVYSIDINKLALEFAKFNSFLNGVRDKINFIESDLFFSIPKKKKFNFICANPPSLPIPSGVRYYLHSNGGQDGLLLVRRIIHDIKLFIKENGVLQMILFSLGNRKPTLILNEIEKDPFYSNAFITIHELCKPLDLNLYIKRIKQKCCEKIDDIKFKNWFENIKDLSFNNLHYIFLEIEFDIKSGIKFGENFKKSEKLLLDMINCNFPYNSIQF